jgi:hypothetical protein
LIFNIVHIKFIDPIIDDNPAICNEKNIISIDDDDIIDNGT